MRDIPILFQPEMIEAIDGGRKTMTRRLAFHDGKPTTWKALHDDFNYRPICGYADYVAGRDGFIYSSKSGALKRLTGSSNSKGYLTVSLCGEDGIRTHAVHCLVAEAWLGPRPYEGTEVRHLNGKRDINPIDNLDWGTPQDNWSDRKAEGNGIHSQHHAAKLTMEKAEEIRRSSKPQRALASEYGVTQSVISDIRLNKIWVTAPPASGRNVAIPVTRLWVREQHWRWGSWEKDWLGAWSFHPQPATMGDIYFGKTPPGQIGSRNVGPAAWHKRPSIFMPKDRSRFTLIVTTAKIEPLQNIDEDDARAEGAEPKPAGVGHDGKPIRTYRTGFVHIWRTIHGEESWLSNPAVVAVSFRVIKANIESIKEAA